MLPVGFNKRRISNNRTPMKQRNAPMSSPQLARADWMTVHTFAFLGSSRRASVNWGCASSSHFHRSWNDAPAASESGVARKSRPLLNGGSVAIRSTVCEFMARMKSMLSPKNRVRLSKFLSGMFSAAPPPVEDTLPKWSSTLCRHGFSSDSSWGNARKAERARFLPSREYGSTLPTTPALRR